jgi:amino-acid N-acetyltransferase
VRADSIRPATSGDWPDIERLLLGLKLPLAGAIEHLHDFVVAEIDGRMAGCAAIERHGSDALLRSVAVDPAHRGLGIGESLVRHLIERTAGDGVHSLVLLTTTAQDWFRRFGFRVTSRDVVAPALTESVEFRDACPSTAVVMSLEVRD